jgi:hypothetical protein
MFYRWLMNQNAVEKAAMNPKQKKQKHEYKESNHPRI